MNTAIQSGYKVRYRQWSRCLTDLEITIEGAVRYKKRGTFWNGDCWASYRFYNKKGEMIFLLSQVEIQYIGRIFTTVLEEPKKSWIWVLIGKLKAKSITK